MTVHVCVWKSLSGHFSFNACMFSQEAVRKDCQNLFLEMCLQRFNSIPHVAIKQKRYTIHLKRIRAR